MMNPQVNMGGQAPAGIILLREGTDTSQGKGAILSHISAIGAVADAVKTTLGPRGMDKLIHDGTKVRISGLFCGVLGRIPRGPLSRRRRRASRARRRQPMLLLDHECSA
jgi:hypothetical protein